MAKYAETEVSKTRKDYVTLNMHPRERVIRVIEREGWEPHASLTQLAEDAGVSYQTADKWAKEYFQGDAKAEYKTKGGDASGSGGSNSEGSESESGEAQAGVETLASMSAAKGGPPKGGKASAEDHATIDALVKRIAQEKFEELAPTLQGDMEALEELVTEAMSKERPPVQITIPDWAKEVEVTPQDHEKLVDAIRLVAVHKQLWLCGPTGSGKTFLSRQIAEKLELPFSAISCTQGMSETHIIGRRNPFSDEFFPSDFLERYEKGGVFLMDEMDATDPNVTVKINSAIANGFMSVETRPGNTLATRHEDFILIIATNTWGSGQTGAYTGRASIDLATRDRFALSKLYVGYSYDLEKELVGEFERKAQDGEFQYEGKAKGDMAQILEDMREKVERNRVQRAISTRTKIGARDMLAAGFSKKEILSILLQDWTDQERSKVVV